ncbi:MAG: cysteine--tRNA ligase [candidate division Zixibacteria bacterium]|nr:cysteine--tRNA ligase [candidate division Zixibacteria bacterium]
MALRFKNSLTRTKEDFHPIEPGKVRLYTCGPTVYDFAHIGNFRTYIFEDLLRRYLKYKDYQVTHVMNLTDVDDKTIRDSRAAGVSLKQHTQPLIKAFFEDLDALGIERAEHYPAATDHIPEMVAMIKQLQDNGLAYEIDGNYYFKISAFPDYGKLANLDLTELKAGARVATDEYEKDSVSDFALWKAWDEDDGDIYWETELGKGRPGWHIECSAMSMKHLGETIDAHSGGHDNIFPHHENEIAQSEGATGKRFVRHWIHCGYLLVDGEKMSKSKGNYFRLRDVLQRGYNPLAIRLLLLSTHYRKPLNFTFEGLKGAEKNLKQLQAFLRRLERERTTVAEGPKSLGIGMGGAGVAINQAKDEFAKALTEDLNIAKALAAIFEMTRVVNTMLDDGMVLQEEMEQASEALLGFDHVLGLKLDEVREGEGVDAAFVETKLAERAKAKKAKDYARADAIRDELAALGVIVEDTPQGTKWFYAK